MADNKLAPDPVNALLAAYYGNPNLAAQGRRMNLPARQAPGPFSEFATQAVSLDPQPDQGYGTMAAEMALGFVPGVGQAMAARDIERARRDNDPLGMGMAASSFVPFGKLINALRGRKQMGPVSEIFSGKNAKTWDPIAAAKAVELEKAGVDAKAIWQQTGTWKAPDGMWRQEIPDATAGFRMDFNSAVPSKSNAYSPIKDMPIGGAFNHPDLYPAYPDILRTGRMEVAKSPDWMPASSNSGNQRGNQFTVRDKTEEGARSTVLHELQHGVQQREGFASGGTPSQFYNEALLRLVAENPRTPPSRLTKAAEDEAFARYRALMGEAEARATQARANLTAAERRNVFPEESYDLPLQLLRAK